MKPVTVRELAIVVRNLIRVLIDSGRSQDILQAEEIICRRRFATLAAQAQQSEKGRALLAERPEISTQHIDYDALRQLPLGTLGRAYADHLDGANLDPDLLWAPEPTPDESDDVWLLRRYRGGHDIWHPLLGLGTEGFEEVLVHAFSLGQLNLPISQMICLFGTPKHIVLEGRFDVLTQQLLQTYQAGRRAASLVIVRWEDHWSTPLETLRKQFNIHPVA